ncbi:hypothetical protein HU200_052447 [Digitaria exilis]|uniref:Protein kinase domain-containing protein n=1 Tax=Digitaria exilis TaxID=1010633 RepID=A0A835ATG0_9POAL|nr:hypothetical protein HU200_052447 [Digitaria exilis]
MADPVVIVEKIIEIAITITDAVETVRENKEECRGIQKLVRRVSDLLSLLKESEMMKHRVVGGPLKDLGDAIKRAHEVVTACQGRNILCLFCKAGKLAKKLSQVKGDISQGMMLAIFATQAASVFIAPKGQQSVLNVSVFFVRTYRPPPLSKHVPSPPHPPVVEDYQPSLITHEPPSHRPLDASVGNDFLPYLPAQEHASCSPIVADVPNIYPHSHGHVSPLPQPPPLSPHPRTNITPLVSKHIPRHPPKQPSVPPCRSPTPPPSPPHHPPIANITSPLSKHLPPSPPTELPTTPASPPLRYPTASVGPQKPGQQPHPSSNVPPDSPPQGSVEVLAPVSASTSSEEDIRLVICGLTKFSLSELKDATQYFSNKNKIGASEYGTVYKITVRMETWTPLFLVSSNPASAPIMGYMPPQYILEGTLSKKYDVYSFGVTLLETISGLCKAEPARHHASVTWAWNVRNNQQMDVTFEASLFEESELPELTRCLEIGLLCTQFEQAERPTMAEILDMLNGKKGLTIPKQPEYTKKKGL